MCSPAQDSVLDVSSTSSDETDDETPLKLLNSEELTRLKQMKKKKKKKEKKRKRKKSKEKRRNADSDS